MKTIAFCMIVKNAAEDLKVIVPRLQHIAVELVIVDTGSTDGTPEVARSLGARVISFVWTDSFAEARNVYIDEATADWILSLDADERIAARDLRLIADAAQKAPRGFLMTTRNYGHDPSVEGFRKCTGEYPEFERGYAGWAPSTKVRMFPRIAGVSYRGEVRELIEPSLQRLSMPIDEIALPIHHFGIQDREKRLYYRRLLEKKTANLPEDPRAQFELAVEDYHLGRYDRTVQGIEKAIALHGSGKRGLYFDLPEAYNLLGVAWMKLGENEKALEAFDKGVKLRGANLSVLKRNRDILLKKASQPSLGAVMIVKNEEEHLGSILSDIMGVVDEVVVVDTGSTDNTIKIVQAHEACIGHFAWCNDFSAARNASIGLAQADYLLWLDADDRIDAKATEALVALKQRLRPEKDRAYLLKILCETRDACDSVSYQTRIFPNRSDIRFEGRIHEQILPSIERAGIKVEILDIPIRHTGYHDPEARLFKGRRNLAILLDELKEGKATPMQYFFIAMSYFGLYEYEQCLEHIKRAREGVGKESWLKYSFSLAVDSYLQLGRIDDALEELHQAIVEFPESGLLQYSLGVVSLQAERIDAAIKAFEKAAKLGIEVETFPVPSNIQEKLPCYYGETLEKAGRREDAIKAYRASLKVNPEWLPSITALGMALLRSGKVKEALPYLEQAQRKTQQYDHPLWLGLASIYCFLGRYKDAHVLYLEALERFPDDVEPLTGLIRTSIEIDVVVDLVSALDALMHKLGMDNDREIDSVQAIAGICAEVGRGLLPHSRIHALKLAESSLRLDEASPEALLLVADIAIANGDTKGAIASLEKAILHGISREQVEARMKTIQGETLL